MSAYWVHVGYAWMLCALVARDVRWLRGILIGAQTVLTAYAVSIGVLPIAGWNALFVAISAVWVVRILRERLSDGRLTVSGTHPACRCPFSRPIGHTSGGTAPSGRSSARGCSPER